MAFNRHSPLELEVRAGSSSQNQKGGWPKGRQFPGPGSDTTRVRLDCGNQVANAEVNMGDGGVIRLGHVLGQPAIKASMRHIAGYGCASNWPLQRFDLAGM